MIAGLWLQLTDIYGQRFINAYGERDTGAWAQTLYDLTEADFRLGLNNMVNDIRFETWPPNCTQFRHLCLTGLKTLGVPSVHSAFREAQHNYNLGSSNWSHCAVKLTVKILTHEVVNDGHTAEAFRRFSGVYEQVCAQIAAGIQLPEVSDEELIHKPKQSLPARPRLSQLLRGIS